MGHPPPRIMVREINSIEDWEKSNEKSRLWDSLIKEIEEDDTLISLVKETLLRSLRENPPDPYIITGYGYDLSSPPAPPKPKNANSARPPAPVEKGLTTTIWCDFSKEMQYMHSVLNPGIKSTR